MMKTVDTREYLAIVEELIGRGESVTVPVAGFSMNPFLADKRDAVMVGKADRKLKRGDIVLYKRRNGQYVLHRIYRVKQEGYYIVGDAQTKIEGPVSNDQIIGIVEKVRRKGKWIDEKDPLWVLFEKVWIRVVWARPFFMKGYSILRKGNRPA